MRTTTSAFSHVLRPRTRSLRSGNVLHLVLCPMRWSNSFALRPKRKRKKTTSVVDRSPPCADRTWSNNPSIYTQATRRGSETKCCGCGAHLDVLRAHGSYARTQSHLDFSTSGLGRLSPCRSSLWPFVGCSFALSSASWPCTMYPGKLSRK